MTPPPRCANTALGKNVWSRRRLILKHGLARPAVEDAPSASLERDRTGGDERELRGEHVHPTPRVRIEMVGLLLEESFVHLEHQPDDLLDELVQVEDDRVVVVLNGQPAVEHDR